MPEEATSTDPGNACHPAAERALVPHLFTLAQEATEQFSNLSVALDTNIFLDSMLEPENGEDTATIFAPLPQLLVLKKALNAEMRRQVKALTHTTDALFACADAMEGSRSALEERVR